MNPDGIPVNPDGIPVNPGGIPTISRSNPIKSRQNPVGIRGDPTGISVGSRLFIPVDPTGIPIWIPVGSHRDSHPFFHLWGWGGIPQSLCLELTLKTFIKTLFQTVRLMETMDVKINRKLLRQASHSIVPSPSA